MKKTLFLFVALCATSLPAIAQEPTDPAKFDPEYCWELYRPYPDEWIHNVTAPPKGYKPFYISHMGRHGSRWSVGEKTYVRPLEIFAAAHEAGELTPTGERFYADWKIIAADAEGHEGELSPQGVREQRGIARRMYESYPEIFATRHGRRSHVDCRSTMVPRCIMSMASFVQELAAHAPQADIVMAASPSNAHYLAAFYGLNNSKEEAVHHSDSVRKANMPDPAPFISRLFREGSTVVSEKITSPQQFMYDMYLANAILAATAHVGINTLPYLFTAGELQALWRCSNMRRYVLTGPSPYYYDAVMSVVRPLLRNIIDTADRAIATGDEQATLRFAHDANMVPFIHAMGIECGSFVTGDYTQICDNWQCNVVTPMATNVQMIFYRNRKGDILVKVLHCEREQKLIDKVGQPVKGCYYRWEDLRRWLESQL